ncbi:MerR family transcriptional regulator [Sphaerisporangium album]|uniref:MerR family transcriptional regulator n=1 Tax=Sphaerisporangium album TaxID=509200 RepID=A0A367FD74_9ACTN|nr:MerR family transcriptional regulator [Sphaerisporangium album]RCG28318.1 MerR family transcriptional regulator [Sphaerisporangium album]
MSDTWTIGELVERAADTLGPSAPRPNGRVRDVPNERLIRWYTTIGLLDPPLTRRGRVALYGRRHLLQLVAVKRRQAEGLSIAEIQAELTGATDGTLEGIARLPAPAAAPDHAADVSDPTPARPRFWAQRPAPAPVAAAPPVVTPSPMAPPASPSEAAAHTDAFVHAEGHAHADGFLHGVRLSPGVTLLIDGRAPSPGDVAALREAALPLLSVLRERHLSAPPATPPASGRFDDPATGNGAGHPGPVRSGPDPSEGMHP